MNDFEKTRWAEKGFAEEYLSAADIQIVDRKRLLEIAKSFYEHFLGNRGGNSILDLGCGDGILTYEFLAVDDSISATLVDGSEDMLREAKQRLRGFANVRFIRASFQELLQGAGIELPCFDFVISSLAVHHLAPSEKISLFAYLYSHINNGGYFLNIDVVLSPTAALESWYVQLWRDWIVRRQTELNAYGDYENVIQKYCAPAHHSKLDTLADQMSALSSVGFREVDCYYKYGIFSIYGGRR
jgi:tRNA (cmo5U34)-methyltransferase